MFAHYTCELLLESSRKHNSSSAAVFIVCDWLRDVTTVPHHQVERKALETIVTWQGCHQPSSSAHQKKEAEGSGQSEDRKQGLSMILRSCECLVSGCIMAGLQRRVMFTNGKILQLRDRSWEKSWEHNGENTLLSAKIQLSCIWETSLKPFLDRFWCLKKDIWCRSKICKDCGLQAMSDSVLWLYQSSFSWNKITKNGSCYLF